MAPNNGLTFHCIICFESFNASDRYPVVLPCGHTFICFECADRLDKCMECRFSLYEIEEPPPDVNRSPTSVTRLRNSRASPTSPTRKKIKKKRLPLPKNLVLLSLMETIRNASDAERVALKVISCKDDAREQEEDEEDEEIELSTDLATSNVFGTYAVSAKEGLEIIPIPAPPPPIEFCSILNPFSCWQEAMQPLTREIDQMLSNIMQFFDGEGQSKNMNEVIREVMSGIVPGYPPIQPQQKALNDEEDPTKGTSEVCCKTVSTEADDHSSTFQDDHSLTLKFGDRVQVVSFNGGFARLARGKGFVFAGTSNLVKVSGPLDEACRVEGILNSLFSCRNQFKTKLDDIEALQVKLSLELEKALLSEDVTIIPAPPSLSEKYFQGDVIENVSSAPTTFMNGAILEFEVPSEAEPPSIMPIPTTTDNIHTTTDNIHTTTDNPTSSDQIQRHYSFPASPNERRTPASPPPLRNRARSFDRAAAAINWRTGMSCHRALQSSTAHQTSNQISKANPDNALLAMSNHCGLNSPKARKNRYSPVMGLSTANTFPTMDNIPSPPSRQRLPTNPEDFLRSLYSNPEPTTAPTDHNGNVVASTADTHGELPPNDAFLGNHNFQSYINPFYAMFS